MVALAKKQSRKIYLQVKVPESSMQQPLHLIPDVQETPGVREGSLYLGGRAGAEAQGPWLNAALQVLERPALQSFSSTQQ